MTEKIKISIPGLYQYTKLNLDFISIMELYPEKFYDDVVIDSMYGCFPCVWNGGRLSNGVFEMEDVIIATTYLNSKDIKVRYTFTNKYIDEDIAKDVTGNAILNTTKEYQSLHNDVIVGNKFMLDYIKENFKEFNPIISTTMMLKTPEEINAYSKDLLVIPDYSINNNFELIDKLENKENIEILVNEECIEDCPMREKHYSTNSLIMLKKDVEPLQCENTKFYNYYSTVKQRRHYVSIDNIRENYLPRGINKFKITGRTTNYVFVIESYIDYFVKPEYKDEIRYELLTKVFESL